MRRPSVIVADDDDYIRDLVARMVATDYEVVALARNGQQLVDMAKNLTPDHAIPDHAIVDISMPWLNGFEALDQIKESGLTTKVILFTEKMNPIYVTYTMEHRAIAHVVKTAGAEDLPLALRAALDGETSVLSTTSVQYRLKRAKRNPVPE